MSPRLLAAMAAAILVAAGCSSSHHRGADATTTSIPATTTTTEPPPQYAPSPYSWDRANSPALQLGGGQSATLSAVLAPQLTGPWLVFGSRLGPSGSPTATVWSSSDALTWTAGSLDPTSGPSQAAAAARYRNTTVVVGSTGVGAGQQAAVWVSTGPGSAFAAQPVPASNGPSVMTQVAAGALGMFAAGTVDGRLAIWSSTNGRQWSELPGAEKAIGTTAGARVNAVVAAGDYVYAAGSIQPGPDPQAALWVTADGLNWHIVKSAASSFSGTDGMTIYSLAPLGTGLVAVGAVDAGQGWVPASWISPDGQSWSLPSTAFPGVPHPAGAAAYLGPAGGTAARAVSAIPTVGGANAVVAAGGGPYGQDAWVSTDGLHWRSLSLPAGQSAATGWRAELTAATADHAVVLDAEPGQPYVLTDRAALLSGMSGPSTAPASIAGTWAQPSTDPGVFGPVRAEAVPVSLIRLLDGGLQLTVDLVRRPQSIGPAAVTTVVLSSADGEDWAVVPGGAATRGPATLPAAGVLTTRVPTGWVAVGAAAGTPPYTWTSPGGRAWTKTADLTVPSPSSPSTSTPASPGTSGPSPSVSVMVNGLCATRLAPSAPSTGSTATGATGAAGAAQARFLVDSVGAETSVSISPSQAGALPSATVTRTAAAWSSSSGAAWRPGSVGAAPPTGGTASMSGCQPVASTLAAYGSATATNGAPQPALWRSTDGSNWNRIPVSAFGAGTPGPIVSLAAAGNYWLAAANPDPTADPLEPGLAAARGPAATAAQDAGVGPAPSVEDGRQGVWLSVDGGSAWQLLDTATAPWLGSQRSGLDLVGFAAGSIAATAPTAVVTGVVDGQLVVWIGTPAPQASSGG